MGVGIGESVGLRELFRIVKNNTLFPARLRFFD